MKQLYLLLIISFAFCSCGQVSIKEEKKSLIDIGFEEIETTEKSVKSNSIFKNSSKNYYGLDISHFQGDFIEKLNSTDSLRFVICKATQGDYFVDPDFRTNWKEIKEKGKIRGTYHFYDCSANPIKQAYHFTTQASDISQTDIAPILDIEQGSMTSSVSGKQMVKDILLFLETVEKTLNRKPILYTDYAFAQEYLNDPALARYDLWLAEYSDNEIPKLPDTWKEKGFKIWQKSDTYHAHSTQLDFDEYHGQLIDLVE